MQAQGRLSEWKIVHSVYQIKIKDVNYLLMTDKYCQSEKYT